MENATFDQSLNGLASATGRRGPLRALSAIGISLLTAMGAGNAFANAPGEGGAKLLHDRRKRKKKRRKNHGATPPVPFQFATRVEVSASSIDLQTAAGSEVSAFADCGGEGKVVSCGYQTSDDPAELVNAFVNAVEANSTRSGCNAFLFRTAEAGATAGASIQAVAVCLV
jgi:hypothetical protein